MEVEQVVAETLSEATGALDALEIASITGLDLRDVDRCLWDRPDLFVWQPGHRWSLRQGKKRPAAKPVPAVDVRREPLVARDSHELRATTLASGMTLRVQQQPLDSDALFSVRSSGSTITLIMNSAHELFGDLPMPFAQQASEPFARLVEILLGAWALHEDGVPSGSTRRALEDTRLMWGRRTIELLRNSG